MKTSRVAATVAHSMMFGDAAWAAETIYSCPPAPRDVGSLLPTLLIGTWSRIVYEGSVALKAAKPVGVPAMANLLEHRYRDVLARARHSTKLLDDTKKGFDDVLADLTAYHDAHLEQFTGNVPVALGWLEQDLSLTTIDEHLVGTSITTHIHLGQLPTTISDTDALGEAIRAASEEQGGALAVLLGLGGGAYEPRPTMDLNPLAGLSARDVRSDQYLERRYDPTFSPPLKLLLLGMEADLGMCAQVLPVLAPGHRDSEFRARVGTVFHALNALREVAHRYSGSNDATHAAALEPVLTDPAVVRLAEPDARVVRNRCVHYEIVGPVASKLAPGAPMHGIVEAATGRTFEEFDADVQHAADVAARALQAWTV